MKTTFIYALCEPGTRKVRYIGKSDHPNKRLRRHRLYSRRLNSHLGAWLRLIHSRQERPVLIVLAEVPYSQWEEEETRYIRAARCLGMDLVNATDGGEGANGLSPEARARLSAALKGKKKSLEHCAAISAGKTGGTRAFCREETREKSRARAIQMPRNSSGQFI